MVTTTSPFAKRLLGSGAGNRREFGSLFAFMRRHDHGRLGLEFADEAVAALGKSFNVLGIFGRIV
jgi:hypothetical protein